MDDPFTFKCDGCGKRFRYDPLRNVDCGNETYCGWDCVPPDPAPANLWERIKAHLGLEFRRTDGTYCKWISL